MSEETQRADVWLFRARLFKSRSGAGRFIEGGAVRLERAGAVSRLTKASAPVRPGDRLVYVRSGRLVRIGVTALGARRGPPAEARTLYVLETAEEKEE
ncbi:MAG: S4 domain-containing protein [Oceanicaulis sp.]